MMSKKKQFPKKLYVKREKERGSKSDYYICETSIENMEEEKKNIGIYELKEVKRLVVTRKLI